MPDRRTARASRLLDPQWHWLASARDRLYAEIEPGAEVVGMGITVRTADGTVIIYGIDPSSDEIARMIIAAPDTLADDVHPGLIDATVPEETPDA